MIEVNIPLFGMASLELPIAGQTIIEPSLFRYKGMELLERMDRVAVIVEKLLNDHWTVVGEVFNLCAYHPHIDTKPRAHHRLATLGIKPDEIFITDHPTTDETDKDAPHLL